MYDMINFIPLFSLICDLFYIKSTINSKLVVPIIDQSASSLASNKGKGGVAFKRGFSCSGFMMSSQVLRFEEIAIHKCKDDVWIVLDGEVSPHDVIVIVNVIDLIHSSINLSELG